jgi:hypothetical protein
MPLKCRAIPAQAQWLALRHSHLGMSKQLARQLQVNRQGLYELKLD